MAERGWGVSLAWMKQKCSLFDPQYIPWKVKGLERVTITLMFFQDFAL